MSLPEKRNHRPDNYQELLAKHRKINAKILPLNTTPIPARAVVQADLEPYTGPWDDQHITHLLKRSLFGVTKNELSAFRGLTMTEAVDQLLIQGIPPQPPVNDYDNTGDGIDDPEIPFGSTWILAGYLNEYEGHRISSLKAWLVHNVINQQATLEEKMMLFWHNLLPTESWGVFFAKLSYRYFEMLRRNAFGNFKTLIRELTLDPSMLLYLNGTFNNKDAPDENYGRELQELFCIGKGPDVQFTEEDVQAAARVLTGWVVDWSKWEASGDMGSLFHPPDHETSDKQFSAFYGNRLITGRVGTAGSEELDELLDMLFDNAEAALYICRRLYTFFVYHEIDATTEQQVIVPLAQLFRESGYEIRPVLEILLKSAHFHDQANHGAMIKNPVDHILGLWRSLSMEQRFATHLENLSMDPTDLNLRFKKNLSIVWNMANLGLELGDPPSVSGWPAYYQAPSFDKYWLTTDTITSRAISSDSLVYWGFWIMEGVQVPADLIAFLDTLDNPDDADLMLKECSLLFHGIMATDEVISNLKKILLSGQQTENYWRVAWNTMKNNPGNEEYRLVVENRLKSTFQALLQMGEAQLM